MRIRITALLLAVILVFSGCGSRFEGKDDGKISIVCAMFAEYDWTRTIVGDMENINLHYLINNGTDSHSYQPTARDIALITDCDLFIYGGGESEAWIDDVLASQTCNPNMKNINMMALLEDRAFEEEIIEGMQESRLEKQEESTSEEDEEPEYDEHIWLSLKNAEIVCDEICSAVSEILPDNSEYFSNNTKAYKEKLEILDLEYKDTVEAAPRKTILVADRFPFRYLVEDYGLNYYAAFSGCNADAEASFETIVFLSDTIKKFEINRILVLEGSDEKLAKAALNTANAEHNEILIMNSMQSVNKKAAANMSYLGVMRQNLRILELALN